MVPFPDDETNTDQSQSTGGEFQERRLPKYKSEYKEHSSENEKKTPFQFKYILIIELR